MPPSASSNRPFLPLIGAGEGSLLVAEQLALQEVVVQDRAVQRDERPLAADVGGVDRLRDQLLARPGLAVDQDGRAERADLLDQVEDLPHLRALRDDVVEAVVLAHLLAELLQLVDQPPALQDAADHESGGGRARSGLVTKSSAPAFIASSATWVSP